MTRVCTLFVIVVLFACNLTLANARSDAGQRDLVKETGLDLVFQDLAGQIRQAASQPGISGNVKLKSAWIRAADEVITSGHLEATMRAEFATTLDDDERTAIHQFLDSPFGQRVVQLERQSMQPSLRPTMLSKGKQLVSSMSERRAVLLAGVLNSSGGRQTSIAIAMNVTIAMMNGMKLGGFFPDSVDDETLNRMIVQQKPKIEAIVDDQLPAVLAFMYHQLTDQELDRYLKFLSSRASMSRNDKVFLALERVISAAVKAFGVRVATHYNKAVRESDL